MNWKTTIVLGVAFAALGGYYLATTSGREKAVDGPQGTGIPALDRLTAIEITRPGKPEIILEQLPDRITGIKWRITKPIDRLANEPLVLDMGAALASLSRRGGIPKGHVDHNIPQLGLDAPEFVVSVKDNTKKITVRFGKRSTRDSSLRFFMIDGDETIYLCQDSVVAPFTKELIDLRNRGLARFESSSVVKIELSSRFEVARQIFKDGKPVTDVAHICDKCGQSGAEGTPCPKCKGPLKARPIPKYEQRVEHDVALIEQRKNGGQTNWHLTQRNGKPTDERLDDPKVTQAVTVLSNLFCRDFVEKADPKTYKLDDPEVKYRVWLRDINEPVEVSLAVTQDAEKRRVVAGMVGGADEIGLVDARQYDQVYKHVHAFRLRQVFDLKKDQIQSLTIRSDIGKLVIVPKDVRGPRTWTVAEPKGFTPLDSDKLDKLIERLLAIEIKDWIPMQEDTKLFGLGDDKVDADITMEIDVKRSADVQERLTFRFSNKSGDEGYLLRPKGTEICVIPGDYATTLDRVDLLAREMEMFHCQPKDILALSVDFRKTGVYAETFYMLTNAGGKWEFSNPELKGQPIDDSQLTMLLFAADLIDAEAFVTRRPEFAQKYGLSGRAPSGRLWLKYKTAEGGTREVALNISEPQSAAGGGEIYYAKFDAINPGEKTDEPFFQIIFRPKRQLIDLMRKGVKKAKGPDEGTDPMKQPPHHGHDDEHPALWTCPNHPDVGVRSPGKCPNCSTDLIQKK